MPFPRIVVNAKVYPEMMGGLASLSLARDCQAEARRIGQPIGFAPPQTELGAVGRSRIAPALLFAQHVDGLAAGVGTGYVTAAMLAAAGAAGSIVNHAEHKLESNDLAAAVARLHEHGLHSLVCADSTAEARQVAKLRPTAVAIEPPELIGGDVSVTSADPKVVQDAVKAVRKAAPGTLVLCGAGVKSGADVRAAVKLGAHGVLLASGVVKAKEPAAALRDLASGLLG
ncbi:MAG: triose-phosphate isomerase [Thermoplasmatota archaeon]